MSRPCVLILGAGINGAALARELVLNGVPVVLVDTDDLASGATSASSRLIHGGLRYLEYGEFDLVRESLEERTRLLRLAPHLVRPLELFIPVASRFGGLSVALRRFVGKGDKPTRPPPSRGLWLVRSGLRLYDLYARDPALPRRRVYRADDPQAAPVDVRRYRWQCSYYDAQVQFPERMVVDMLEDARRAAEAAGISLQVHLHCRVRLRGKSVEVLAENDRVIAEIQPAALVNATGAWVDDALHQLGVASQRLIGGTKGSHFLTNHEVLRESLAGRGVYAEADDGRPVFLLPLGAQVLVGTTDVPFEGDPRDARATDEELDYLVGAVNRVFPQVRLTRDDIDWHYAGVRPLPYVGHKVPASITRRHWLHEHADAPLPAYSVIGGKLTTCRSLAESAAQTLLHHLGWPVKAVTRDRPFPGAEGWPEDALAVAATQQQQAERLNLDREQVAAVWQLCGTRAVQALAGCEDSSSLDGTSLPVAFARWVIEHEWVHNLDDLVERRLMLLYQTRLTRQCLEQLAELMACCGRIAAERRAVAVAGVISRLRERYGKAVQ